MKNFLIFLMLGSSLVACIGQAESLPEPTGPYSVGVTYLDYVDTNRTELFDNYLQKPRKILVKAWYPSDVQTQFEPYLLPAEAEFAITYLQFPELYRSLGTNSSRDVPLSSENGGYPVLIFSHGLGEHYSQNSILMEHLASHGFVVFSIAHLYECAFSSFPDGRLFYIDMNSRRLQKIMGEMASPEALATLENFSCTGTDDERIRVFTYLEKLMPLSLSESPYYWAKDILFFMDQLEDLNEDNPLFMNKLNLDNIGAFGMSLGGLASMEASLLDTRIKACVNMDGGLNAVMLHKKMNVPAMFMNSRKFKGYGNIFTQRSASDSYSMTVSNADHYNFSDYSLYPVPKVKMLLGIIDGARAIEIMNVLVLVFFDTYLNGKMNVDVMRSAAMFPEIEAAAKY
jgi:predicted dienelactone hydrolase